MIEEEINIYREFQKHLDKMPVGYPATESGIEIKILEKLFTPEQVEIALKLNFMADPLKRIYRKLKDSGFTMEELETKLDEMYFSGLINRGIVGEGESEIKYYGCAPVIIGFFEYQLKRLTPELYKLAHEYIESTFFKEEYNKTGIPQLRVIPLEQTVDYEQSIAQYDDLRSLIEVVGEPIAVMDCICRIGKDLVGEPCTKTKLRESCFAFRGGAKNAIEKGDARAITKEEALKILEKAEDDGLVLQPGNSLRPMSICTCCGCCCGVLSSQSLLPEISQFFATNYYAKVDEDLCIGCGICEERCNVDAIHVEDAIAEVDRTRCIGCGVCVPTCSSESISLVKKEEETLPPKNTLETYTKIMDKKAELARAEKTQI
ncbi:MAG: ATP-binding protein [Promethearchaeota archaeon]|jgi:NAD-dependent dihydropyrimidine dehydrogenase PreA subunit/DNA-binding Lrp family transcriptional regulator